MIPETLRDILETNALAHVATLGPQGQPQSTPVWFGWDGEFLRFSLTKGRQKYRNLLRDNRIALSIVDPTNPYRYLEVRGQVERIDDDEGKTFINSMAKKYMGVDVYPWSQPEEQRVVVVVKPEHTTTMS